MNSIVDRVKTTIDIYKNVYRELATFKKGKKDLCIQC